MVSWRPNDVNVSRISDKPNWILKNVDEKSWKGVLFDLVKRSPTANKYQQLCLSCKDQTSEGFGHIASKLVFIRHLSDLVYMLVNLLVQPRMVSG